MAFTDLRDKDVGQVDEDIRKPLREMKSKEKRIYEVREWLGVAFVVAAAALAEVHWTLPRYVEDVLAWLHQRYPMVHLGPETEKFALSVLFTTLPVVWFAQAPAKSFAVWNSVEFIKLFRSAWPILKLAIWFMEVIHINVVTELIHWVTKAWSKDPRNLKPSDYAFYVSSVRRYGYGIHDRNETIVVRPNGSAMARQTSLIHVLAADRTTFESWTTFASRCVQKHADVLRAVLCPLPGEKIIDFEEQIARFHKGDFQDFPEGSVGVIDVSTAQNQNRAVFEIRSIEPLGTADPPQGAIVLFETNGEWDEKAFETAIDSQDYFEFTCEFPYRRYFATIMLDPNCPFSIAATSRRCDFRGNRHDAEASRITIRPVPRPPRRLEIEILYPLPGSTYRIDWKIWSN